MALVRCTLIAAGMIAASAGGHAGDAARVVALGQCPNTQEKAASGCVEMMMHWDFARTDKPPFVGKRASAGDSKTVRVLAVRGRLGKGRVRAFELAVSSRGSLREDYIGEVAYLGRSRDGRPTIVTDQGPLALETRGLHVGRAQSVVIIDVKAKKVVQSYLGGLNEGFYVVRGPDQMAALAMSGACVSPPMSRPGVLTRVASCSDPKPPPEGLSFSERLSGAISPAPDADLAMIRKLLPQTSDLSDEELRAKIGRIGPDHLVVTPWKD